jgi:uroporphyrin-III C-methyltransferase/precorrin-2 dehydrogenase/sirohydrochlorin ferrochelatase
MDYLPLFVALRGRTCVLVGGGSVARRKLEWLVRAGARVVVVAPVLDAQTATLAVQAGIEVRAREFLPSDCDGAVLVVSATNDRAVNRAVHEAATARGIWINTVDAADLSNVIFPSIVDRDPVFVAIGTSGTSPTLARVVRGWIEARLPARLGALATLLGKYRTDAKSRIADLDARRRFWERIVDGPVAERVFSGDDAGAERSLRELLATPDATTVGTVYLVGGGPGDPDLLTLKAARCLEQADVVLYDNLVSPRVLERVRRDAERIYVGKRRAFPSIRQQAINRLLVEHARAGKRVVRLKGGDPYVFGRGGEETLSLAEDGVPCVVVPGITAALGCASYAGIPLTHRDHAQSVRFVVGTRKDGRVNLDWGSLVRADETLVVYMGRSGLREICAELEKHGLDASTPGAVVEWGTLANQRVIEAPLSALADAVDAAQVEGPNILIVGKVVALRRQLQL